MNCKQLEEIFSEYYGNSNPITKIIDFKKINDVSLTIISPTWKPHFVFDDEYDIETLKAGSTSFHLLKENNKKILFVKTGKGAPNLVDNLLLLYKLESDFVFLGSSGSIDYNINIGDIVLPISSISGNGASIYFNDSLDKLQMFKKEYFSCDLSDKIVNCSKSLGIEIKKANVFSTDSIIGEYYHLREILSSNINCIEQETASFAKCMKIIEKKGAALLVISDNLLLHENYYDDNTDKSKYIESREKVLKKIIKRI